MEPRIQYAKTEDGVSIAFTVLGSGSEVLVAAPGMPGDLQIYKVGLRLAALFDGLTGHGLRVVLHDSRNTGSSEHRDTDYSIRARLVALEAVADHVDVGQFSLYGHTAGCLTAIAYAVEHPDRVKRLVLSNPYARGEDYYTTVPQATTIARLSAENMTAEEKDIYYQSMAGILSGFSDPENAAKIAAAWRTSISVDEMAAFREALRNSDVTDLLPQVAVPTLVVFSLWSIPALLPLTREVARLIPGPEFLETVAQGSRMLNFDPVDAIDAFLRGEPAPDVAEVPLATPTLSEGMTAILFLDIAGSTALTTKLGDAAYRERERALDASLRAAITDAGGTPLEGKLLGDGILSVYRLAKDAINAARRCRDLGDKADLPLVQGIHAGDVIHEENDVRGGAVQVAARVQGIAAPGEILVSDTVRSLARTSAGVTFEDRGEHALKGIPEPQRLYAVQEQS